MGPCPLVEKDTGILPWGCVCQGGVMDMGLCPFMVGVMANRAVSPQQGRHRVTAMRLCPLMVGVTAMGLCPLSGEDTRILPWGCVPQGGVEAMGLCHPMEEDIGSLPWDCVPSRWVSWPWGCDPSVGKTQGHCHGIVSPHGGCHGHGAASPRGLGSRCPGGHPASGQEEQQAAGLAAARAAPGAAPGAAPRPSLAAPGAAPAQPRPLPLPPHYISRRAGQGRAARSGRAPALVLPGAGRAEPGRAGGSGAAPWSGGRWRSWRAWRRRRSMSGSCGRSRAPTRPVSAPRSGAAGAGRGAGGLGRASPFHPPSQKLSEKRGRFIYYYRFIVIFERCPHPPRSSLAPGRAARAGRTRGLRRVRGVPGRPLLPARRQLLAAPPA